MIIALIDTLKSKVVATYIGAIHEDAAVTLGDNSFNIDTARYNLAPGVRAFGLDVSTSYSQGCVDGGVGPTRTLYVQDGKTIRPILEYFYIYTWKFANLGGRPNCVNGEGDEVTANISYSIGISKATTNGYSNLLITANGSYSNGDKYTQKPFQYELHYDGNKYPTGIFNGADAKLEKELENWQKLP